MELVITLSLAKRINYALKPSNILFKVRYFRMPINKKTDIVFKYSFEVWSFMLQIITCTWTGDFRCWYQWILSI